MSVRSVLLFPVLALLCGGAVVVGMPALRPRPVATPVPAPAAALPVDEDPSEFPPHPRHVHGDRDAHAAADRAAQATALARARDEAEIAMLDARFAAEPLNPAWAQREEQALRAFFADDTRAVQGLPAPVGLHTACHSATCRVSMRYADGPTADNASRHLALHVAPRLPYGAILPRALDDGSVQIEAWYSARRILR